MDKYIFVKMISVLSLQSNIKICFALNITCCEPGSVRLMDSSLMVGCKRKLHAWCCMGMPRNGDVFRVYVKSEFRRRWMNCVLFCFVLFQAKVSTSTICDISEDWSCTFGTQRFPTHLNSRNASEAQRISIDFVQNLLFFTFGTLVYFWFCLGNTLLSQCSSNFLNRLSKLHYVKLLNPLLWNFFKLY